MLSHFSGVQLFATLWTVARQAPLSMGCSRQKYWSGLSCPPPGHLPCPEIKPMSPALRADPLPLSNQGSPRLKGGYTRTNGLRNPSIFSELTMWVLSLGLHACHSYRRLTAASTLCLPILPPCSKYFWTEDSTWPVQGCRLEAPGRWCPLEKRSTRAADESQFKTTPGSPPGGRTRRTKLCSTLSPPGLYLWASVNHSINSLSKEPYVGYLLTYLLAPLVLSAIASQTGCSTCPWILVSRSASAGAQPKTALRHVLFKGRNPLSSENKGTKWDSSLAKRPSAQWKVFILVYFSR